MNDAAEITRVLGAYHAAMIAARVTDLDALLGSDFVLVHITGVTQPKQEWFDAIRSGRFDYHSIALEELSLAARVTGDGAEMTGRGVFDATIDGMRHPWRLQFAVRFAKTAGHWLITRARYTSF